MGSLLMRSLHGILASVYFVLLLFHLKRCFASEQEQQVAFSTVVNGSLVSSQDVTVSMASLEFFPGIDNKSLEEEQRNKSQMTTDSEGFVSLEVIPEPMHNSSIVSGNDKPGYTSVPVNKPLFQVVFTTIGKGKRHVYHYCFKESILARWPAFQLQLYAETNEVAADASFPDDHPLVVTAQWWGMITSWKIPAPFVNETTLQGKGDKINRFSNNVVGKTIWNYSPSHKSYKGGNFTVTVSSFSAVDVIYKLKIVALKDFVVKALLSTNGAATPASPAFYKFTVPPGWESAFVHVVSNSDACAMLTVERLRGPFLDTDDSSQKVQFSETFTRKTGLTINTENFSDGFLVAFTPLANDQKCITKRSHNKAVLTDNEFRNKIITFEIRQGPSPISFLVPVTFPLFIFFLIATFVCILMIIFHKIRHNTMEKNNNILIKRCLTQFTSNITINDLIVTEPSRVVDQSRRYCTAGFVTSAFYSVPVFQLIFTFSRQLIDTGNFDLCYFNHFCSHALGTFHDFNHMYSNIWYILFGILYMIMVRIRQSAFDPDYAANEMNLRGKNKVFMFFHRADGRMDRGVMTHYGLLYCMGYALIMTGVMSAAYHICPNQSNFQFDTVFMYTIAAITVVTLYQARHATYLSANFTFTALALVTSITVMGLLWEQFYIRVIFSVTHMAFLLLTLPKVFYSGYIRKNGKLVVHWKEVMQIFYLKLKDDLEKGRIFKFQKEIWYAPDSPETIIIPGPGRVILPGFLLLINCVAIATMWTYFLEENFATQVLFICVINGALYMIFYTALKLFHGECYRILWIQPLIYLLASFALWGTALTFFFDEVSTWETSPAQSRLKNRECTLLSFYDSHDMWHFLSAAALFFSAMVLLTVDDDLVDQPKSTIPVF